MNFITYNRVKLGNPVIHPLIVLRRETRWTIIMKLPINVRIKAAEAHPFTSASKPAAFPETLKLASRNQEMRLCSIVHLNFDHTWGKIPFWVCKTHRNSLIILPVASDLIRNGMDVYHPDAGQYEYKYTLFS